MSNERSPVAALSAMTLLYGPYGGAWFAFLWYLTAPLVVLRPLARLICRKEGSGAAR